MNSLLVLACVCIALGAVMAFPSHEHHFVPHYHYAYGVHDPHTHDHKSQKEDRHHDDVHGSYTHHEPDGTKRVVEYHSDKHEGFQALVKREGHAKHPHGATSYVGTTHWGHGSGR
ncbi:cuticle protein 19 [Dendroctonus ponderosae]